jgi:membrane protein implicated in regulation of membrane protease activity
MNGRPFSIGASSNPLVQILSLVVFAVIVAGAVIMGAFVLLAFVGVAAIAVVVLSVRSWWLKRKLRSSSAPFGDDPKPVKGVRYIEGEFKVIDSDAEAKRRRSNEDPRE